MLCPAKRHDNSNASKVVLDRGLIAAETNPFIAQVDHQVNCHSGITAEKYVEQDLRTSVEVIGCKAFQKTLTQKVKTVVKFKNISHSK